MSIKRVGWMAALLLCLVMNLSIDAWGGPPYATDDPEPVEYKHWEINFAMQTATDRDRSGTVAISGTAPNFDINYGVLPETQFNLAIPFAYSAPSGQATQYGLGDVQIGMKRRFIKETERSPQVSLYPLVLFPSGNEKSGLSEGHVQMFVPLWLQKSWGEWTTYGGGGYWIERIAPNSGDRNFWQLGLVLQRDISKNLALGAEFFQFTRSNNEQLHNRSGFNVGSTINLSENHHILLSAGRDFLGENKFSAYVAYQLSFGPKEEDEK